MSDKTEELIKLEAQLKDTKAKLEYLRLKEEKKGQSESKLKDNEDELARLKRKLNKMKLDFRLNFGISYEYAMEVLGIDE